MADSTDTAKVPPAATPDSKQVPLWRAATGSTRVFFTMLSILISALVCEQGVRLALLLGYRNERRKIRIINRMVRLWGVSTFWAVRVLLRLKLRIEGELPRSGRFFIISNHQSSIDIPMLISVLRRLNLKFVAMEELRYGKPGVSLGLRHGGFAFVAKRDIEEDLAELRRFGSQLERYDGSPAIFPEGRRTDDGELLPFKFAGTNAVSDSSGLPLLPVTIEGLWKARTIKEFELVVGNTVTVRISEPLSPTAVRQQPQQAFRQVERTIRDNLSDIRTSRKAGIAPKG